MNSKLDRKISQIENRGTERMYNKLKLSKVHYTDLYEDKSQQQKMLVKAALFLGFGPYRISELTRLGCNSEESETLIETALELGLDPQEEVIC